MPAAGGLFAGLCLAHLQYVLDLYREAGRQRPASTGRGQGYNAESTITRDGKQIVFTSMRNGDLDIYTMDADGSNVRQLTHELGYDGGPFWSYDGKKIVYRAEHPKTRSRIADYKGLLARGLIRPGNLEIWVMNADGNNKRQVTHNGAANFAPYLVSRRQAHHFRVQHGQSKRSQRLRSLRGQRRRHRP